MHSFDINPRVQATAETFLKRHTRIPTKPCKVNGGTMFSAAGITCFTPNPNRNRSTGCDLSPAAPPSPPAAGLKFPSSRRRGAGWRSRRAWGRWTSSCCCGRSRSRLSSSPWPRSPLRAVRPGPSAPASAAGWVGCRALRLCPWCTCKVRVKVRQRYKKWWLKAELSTKQLRMRDAKFRIVNRQLAKNSKGGLTLTVSAPSVSFVCLCCEWSVRVGKAWTYNTDGTIKSFNKFRYVPSRWALYSTHSTTLTYTGTP